MYKSIFSQANSLVQELEINSYDMDYEKEGKFLCMVYGKPCYRFQEGDEN